MSRFRYKNEIERGRVVFTRSVKIHFYSIGIMADGVVNVKHKRMTSNRLTKYFERGGTLPKKGNMYANQGFVVVKWSDPRNVYIGVLKRGNINNFIKHGRKNIVTPPKNIERRIHNRIINDALIYLTTD